MGLDIKNLWSIELFGHEIMITETIFNTWIVMGILIVLAIIARIKLRNFKEVPTGLQNVIEAIVETFENFASNTLGETLSYISPWYFMVFMFILTSNLVSVFGMRAPTADWATTFALALASFLLMIFMGLKHKKGEYIKGLFAPHPVFFPLNLLGELAKPISLSFRLFGNVLSGTIILTLYYSLTPILIQIGVPALLHAIFDVVFGALQTYIFVIISLMYVRSAAE